MTTPVEYITVEPVSGHDAPLLVTFADLQALVARGEVRVVAKKVRVSLMATLVKINGPAVGINQEPPA